MEEHFWRARWDAGQIGFHEGSPNALLVAHAGALAGRTRILVPLCGKSVDLRALRDLGLEVVGVEFVRDAAEAFFREQGIATVPVRIGALDGWSGDGITILVGDFFLTARSDLGEFDALYDRAALVAVEPGTRERYVRQCRSMLAPDATALVVAFEYDQSRVSGPPFSVDEATIRSLYDGASVTELGERDAGAGTRFSEAGVPWFRERIYAIRTAG